MNVMNHGAMIFGLLCVMALPACTQKIDADRASARAVPDSGQEAVAVPAEGPVDDATAAKVRAAIKKAYPDEAPEYIGYSSFPGILEVFIKGQVVFVSSDGNYLMHGVYDIANQRDLSQSGAMPSRRLSILQEIPASQRIIFAPSGYIKHTVTVFTDVECGFCQKLHKDIAEYNKLGIAVEYLAYPRAGMGSPDAAKMQSVWCSKDRRKAMTDAKSGIAIPRLSCADPIAKHREIGERIGLRGTPMIIATDGVALAGYMPPDKLLEALDKQASNRGSL
jgi:thiol:disulfide interchange protein DsbC